VDEALSNAVKNRLLSAFPEGTFARVDVLGYGDDPAVEPGETAVRVFIDRAGRPEESWDSRETPGTGTARGSAGRNAVRRRLDCFRLS
jgi:hypothetical protein